MENFTVRKSAVLTPVLGRTLEILDPFFAGERSEVTSGLRTAAEQLEIIKLKVVGAGLRNKHFEFNLFYDCSPETTCSINGSGKLYWWQRSWSELLSSGKAVVNPPISAACLFDYQSDGINKKGKIIPISTHQMGLAVDIGGGNSLDNKTLVLQNAMKATECFIKSWRREAPPQNCLHVTCFPI